MPSYTVSVGKDGVNALLEHPALNDKQRVKILRKSLTAGGLVLERGLKLRIPVRSGQTRSRITGRISLGMVTARMAYVVGGKSITAGGFNILKGLEEGTGIYGPRKQKITPLHAKALRWYPKSAPVTGTVSGKPVFARSVKGMKPVRPFHRTVTMEGPNAVAVFKRVFAQQFLAARTN